ncbi:hypothetical protein ACOSQ3_013415 [Xanthoceras sorbifolium]
MSEHQLDRKPNPKLTSEQLNSKDESRLEEDQKTDSRSPKVRKQNKSEACQKAFDSFKMAIVIEPVLKLPEFEKPFSVETFTSGRDLDRLST